MHPTLGGALHAVDQAEARTVDDVVTEAGLPRIDLIKLDVDGHELTVLQGARETLKRFMPPLLIELGPLLPRGAGA